MKDILNSKGMNSEIGEKVKKCLAIFFLLGIIFTINVLLQEELLNIITFFLPIFIVIGLIVLFKYLLKAILILDIIVILFFIAVAVFFSLMMKRTFTENSLEATKIIMVFVYSFMVYWEFRSVISMK
ncbi:hypothetical protein J7L48_11545 [bacterium]|nr:hypothetical protein [bacterium]